jgi:hypothetical protein
MTSPILDRNGQELSFNMSGPPNAVIRQLQAELKRAFAQVRQKYGLVYLIIVVDMRHLDDRCYSLNGTPLLFLA